MVDGMGALPLWYAWVEGLYKQEEATLIDSYFIFP